MNLLGNFQFAKADSFRVHIPSIFESLHAWHITINPDDGLMQTIRKLDNYEFWLSEFIFDISLPSIIRLSNRERKVDPYLLLSLIYKKIDLFLGLSTQERKMIHSVSTSIFKDVFEPSRLKGSVPEKILFFSLSTESTRGQTSLQTNIGIIIRTFTFNRSTNTTDTGFVEALIQKFPKNEDELNFERVNDFYFLLFVSYFAHMETYSEHFEDVYDYWKDFTPRERYGIDNNLYHSIEVEHKRKLIGLRAELNETILALVQTIEPQKSTPRTLIRRITQVEEPTPIEELTRIRLERFLRHPRIFQILEEQQQKDLEDAENSTQANRILQLFIQDFITKNIKYSDDRTKYHNFVFGPDTNNFFLKEMRERQEKLGGMFLELSDLKDLQFELRDDTLRSWKIGKTLYLENFSLKKQLIVRSNKKFSI